MSTVTIGVIVALVVYGIFVFVISARATKKTGSSSGEYLSLIHI